MASSPQSNPGSTGPNISVTRLLLSFGVSVLIGIALVFDLINQHFGWNLPVVGPISSTESTLLMGILMVVVTMLGVFVLYQLFVLIDR